MNTTPLFPDADETDDVDERRTAESAPPAPPPAARLRRPDRKQIVLRPTSLDELLPDDHAARVVWRLVETWSLEPFLAKIAARLDRPGRPATDPKLLVALWLYASTEGVASGRELERLCRDSTPYRWLCGDVSVNYHLLNDFRVEHETALDGLLTQMLAVLMRDGLVGVTRIAQDGTRVRAGAGANSFKRRGTLESALQAARDHLAIIQRQAQKSEEKQAERRRLAESRAAERQVEKIERSLAELAKLEEAKARQKAKPTKENPPRASVTDPDARFMRMPDGGCRPAYNVQLAVDVESRAIVGVDVVNAGSDAGLAEPMQTQIAARVSRSVADHLLDGGYVQLAELERLASGDRPTTVYMPVPKPRKKDVDPHAPKRGDAPGVAAWRVRMGTPAAKAIYKRRAATVETVNAELKTARGLKPFRVRGLRKARCAALWSVLAYNFVHWGRRLLALSA